MDNECKWIPMDIAELQRLVTEYGQAPPDKAVEIETKLKVVRRELVSWLLELQTEDASSWLDDSLRNRFQLMRRAGLHDLPRDPDEQTSVESILAAWESGRNAACLMAGMLMVQPFEFPLPENFMDIPEILVMEYTEFLLTSPGVFHRVGEADRYAEFLQSTVGLLHRALVLDEGCPRSADVQNLFVNRANFIQFYFNDKDLHETYRKRAEIMEKWALDQNAPIAHLPPLTRPRGGARKLKLGILSSHFTPQTEVYLMLSYFDRLPRETFSVTLYSMSKSDHPLETYCRGRVDHFVQLPEGAYPVKADRIRADEPDVLMIGTNTSAVTNPITIMAMFRMAKIQVIFENSPVSTGFTHTDYYLTSMFNEPGDDAWKSYNERLYRVPGMLNYYAYHHDQAPRTVNVDRAGLDIPADAVVFFSGANFYKLLPELSRLWAGIFSQVPNSFLVLIPFNPNWSNRYLSRPFIDRLRIHMEEAGVDFSRIRILNRLPARADVHGLMSKCDIYLDSLPYAGACSLIDPLTVGLPIVCHQGSTMRGSLAAAMLKGAGLDEMIVNDREAYVEKAVALGNDPALRQKYRLLIQGSLSRYNPFFDTGACGTKIAAAVLDMADRQHLDEIRLLQQGPEELAERIRALSGELGQSRNRFFANLAGPELVRLLILPYLRSLADLSRPPLLVDLGAGDGRFSMPFLMAGCHADMVEPDSAHKANLEAIIPRFPGNVRHIGSLNEMDGHRIREADIVRIGAGFDNPIPAFSTESGPRLLVVEFDNRSADTALTNRSAAWGTGQAESFEAVIFGYDPDALQVPAPMHRLKEVALVPAPTSWQGNIPGCAICFRKSDPLFLVTLVRLLEGFIPAGQRNGHSHQGK